MKNFTAYILFLVLAAMSASTSAFPLGKGVLGVAIFGDTDGDFVVDPIDAFPEDPAEWSDADNDGIGDVADTDDDNDGVLDVDDAFPFDATEALDTDKDGLGNSVDADDDNDGVLDINDAYPLDASRIGGESEQVITLTPAAITLAVGSNGISLTGQYAASDAAKTTGFGVSIYFDSSKLSFVSLASSNALGAYVLSATTTPDAIQDDTDNGDGDITTDKKAIIAYASFTGAFPASGEAFSLVFDAASSTYEGSAQVILVIDPAEGYIGIAEPAVIHFVLDSDNDGVLDVDDAFPFDPSESVDTDGDGIGDNADPDDDGDGQSDSDELACGSNPLAAGSVALDTDNDLRPDCVDPDDDNDGVADAVDAFPLISLGSRLDSDADGRPNICDTACLDLGMSEDTDDDNDGVLDDEDRFPLDARYALDADADTMADEWELYFTLDPTNHRDAYFDLDQDGYLNWEEFYADTDPTIASGPAQVLYTDRAATLIPGSSARLSVRYTTTDTDPNLSGMGVRVHYNSKYLTAISLENIFETSLLSVGEPVEDSFDLDGDAETDSYILVAWVSFSGPTWPGELGQVLFDVVLSTTSEIAELEEYPIRFSVSDTPTGYNLSAPSIYNPVVLASLDIDGDGEAKALTDGLMIIRRLFGFSGNSLSAGAVAASATYTTSAELAARIDAFATGLDIDGDGETKALTDGLMIIRRLFGFSGSSLIAGAVSATATRTESADIAAYIDSLVP